MNRAIGREGNALYLAPLLLAAAAISCFGGTASPNIGFECTQSIECSEGLVCEYGRCRQTCERDLNCPDGGACIAPLDFESRVCTISREQSCEDRNSGDVEAHCPERLYCGPNHVCREGCEDSSQCEGSRTCVEGIDCLDDVCVCVEND